MSVNRVLIKMLIAGRSMASIDTLTVHAFSTNGFRALARQNHLKHKSPYVQVQDSKFFLSMGLHLC